MNDFTCPHCNKIIKDGTSGVVNNSNIYHTKCFDRIRDLKTEKAFSSLLKTIVGYGIDEDLVWELEDNGNADVIDELARELAYNNDWLLVLIWEHGEGYSVRSYKNITELKKYILSIDEEWEVHSVYYQGIKRTATIVHDVKIV